MSNLGSVNLRPLTADDKPACVAVENAAFSNPAHRASTEKIAYRLAACPELCIGAFADKVKDGSGGASHSAATETVLVAHIVATRCHGPVVTDASMACPSSDGQCADLAVGNQPDGTTVAIHSLAVAPSAQRKGLGTRLMAAYVAQLRALPASPTSSPVQRISLICQDFLVNYYKKLGFTLLGPSAATFGGGGWFDMCYNLTAE